jgi:transaldolase
MDNHVLKVLFNNFRSLIQGAHGTTNPSIMIAAKANNSRIRLTEEAVTFENQQLAESEKESSNIEALSLQLDTKILI